MSLPPKPKQLTSKEMFSLLLAALLIIVASSVVLYFAGYMAVEIFHALGYFPDLKPVTLGLFLSLLNLAMSLKNPMAAVRK